jgi:uncharacterized membrane protein YhhN
VRSVEGSEVVRRAWPLLAAYVAVAALHLAVVAGEVRWAAVMTKPVLVPLLLVWFLRAAPPGWLRSTVAAGLALSLAGDVLLLGSGDGWFLAGLGAFLLAQVAYSLGFVRFLGASVVRRRPLLVLPYLAFLVVLVGGLASDLGAMLVPVAVYGVVIVTMAVLATGVSPLVALGAVLFVVSDALIAATSLTGLLDLPASGVWVMATYLAAQALIAVGVAARLRRTGARREAVA